MATTNVPTDDILAAYPNATPLSSGGQKVVFFANHPQWGEVVLKIGVYSSNSSLERVKREVDVLKSITSPYYPKNLDFQLFPNNRFLSIEEYIPSKPLSELITGYAVADAVELILTLTNALELLWGQKIIHRDLKPDNILIANDGTVKVIDLGIAKLLDFDSLTKTMAMVGPCTPPYAAPEQLRNQKNRIDFRTDQFCLGIVLGQLILGGKHPFDPHFVGSGSSIMENIIDGKWCRNLLRASASGDVARLVEQMLALQQYKRFRTAKDLRSALNSTLESLA